MSELRLKGFVAHRPQDYCIGSRRRRNQKMLKRFNAEGHSEQSFIASIASCRPSLEGA
jgi:hypothetical protein